MTTPMQRGDAIDRFTVLEHLGEGGMGVVVSAYDPALEIGIALLYAAVLVGSEARDDVRVAKVLRDLLFYTGVRAQRLAEAAGLWTIAEAAAARAGSRDDVMAELLSAQGSVLNQQGRPADAAERLSRAIAFTEKGYGPDHPDVARLLLTLGNAQRLLGRWDARRLLDDVVAVTIKAYGDQHPYVAQALTALATAMLRDKDPKGARAAYSRALAILRSHDPHHPDVALPLRGLGEVDLAERHYADAIAHLGEAKAIMEQGYGPDHVLVAPVLADLGQAQLEAGHPRIAVELLERAVAIDEAQGVTQGAEGARGRFQLARALWATGRRRRAVELAKEARESFARAPLAPERDDAGRWLERHSIR